MIQIREVKYSYPNSHESALASVNLKIGAGEFVLLAGGSGSGKTTLLRCINGLVPHFSGGDISGMVTVNNVDVIETGPSVMSQIVGFVAQNPEGQALLDTVEPEIAFALENAAIPAQEMRIRVEEALDLLDLTELRDRTISSLSGGERQRVAIAAVLALRPQIILLDEPTSQLDPKSADDVLSSLVRLNEDLGLTIILAEHRLERVLRYADRIVFMESGRIIVDDWMPTALVEMPHLPPLVKVGRVLGWQPLPVTVKQGRRYASQSIYEMDKAPYDEPSRVPKQSLPLLEVKDIHYAYDGQEVLKGVSLQAVPGEVLTIMGRNGSGKSTLLKCVMGLLQVTQGSICFEGQPLMARDVVEIAKDIAYLPQNPNDLLFAESVDEEFRITLDNHGINEQEGVSKLILDLGLEDVQDAYPRDLSTGQRQRVAMGAVTVTEPRLLLLDEPTRGLDVNTKQSLIRIWREWLAKGMSLVLVTHDVELSAAIADRIVILSQGEIIASGPTVEVLSGSPLFAPQISRLFPGRGWLTADQALDGLALKRND